MMRVSTVIWLGLAAALFALPVAPSMAFLEDSNNNHVSIQWQPMYWFGQTPVAYQYKVANSMRYAATGLGTYPWTVRAAYDTFESDDMKGKNLTAIVGYHAPRDPYEEALDDLAWGIKSIEEWWCCDDYDFVLYEGVAPYISYRHQDLTVGGYVLAGYTFSDEPEVSEELFYGLGIAAAYRLKLAEDWGFTPRLSAQYYDSGQSGWEDSLSITASAGVKWAVTDRVKLGLTVDYTVETADVVDDNWYGLGLSVSGSPAEYLKLSAGIKTTQGFDGPSGDSLDLTTFSVGARLDF